MFMWLPKRDSWYYTGDIIGNNMGEKSTFFYCIEFLCKCKSLFHTGSKSTPAPFLISDSA